MKKILYLSIILLLIDVVAFAQVGINADGSTPDSSSMLDIKSTTKGVLVPRVTSAQRAAIKSPAKGLLVFDSTTASFWFHNGVSWNELTAGGNGWNLTGNSNTSSTGNFIGTTDKEPLLFKVNSIIAGRLDTLANAAFGTGALAANTAGHNLVAIGDSALFNQSTNANGTYGNTAIGSKALFANGSGYGNTAVGYLSLYTNGTGANTANDEGCRNTAVGDHAMYLNTTGLYNTAIGSSALSNNTTGYFNSALGYGALGTNSNGTNNTGIGLVALAYNTSGAFNTALGARALQNNTTGFSNIALGSYALYNNIDGNSLIAIGDSALFTQEENRLGYYGNIGIGTRTLYANSAGTNNTATGYTALTANTSGTANTANGADALVGNTTGHHNTAVGSNTLNSNATGTYLTAIGYDAITTQDGLTNATAIGANAVVAQSNSLVLGAIAGQNAATASTNVGIGVAAPLAPLHIHSANADNWQNAKSVYLEDANSLPTIHFHGSGAYSNRWWNITLEPYTPTSGDNAGIPGTDLVLSNDHDYPNVRFEQGLTQFEGAVDITDDATVEGTLHLSNAINYSDVRLKEDIEPLQNVLPDLSKLNGYTYYWKNHKDPTQQIGVLAQEVQKVFPQLVQADDKGVLGVNYIQLIPVLLTAIKEQQKEIDGLREEIKRVETMVRGK